MGDFDDKPRIGLCGQSIAQSGCSAFTIPAEIIRSRMMFLEKRFGQYREVLPRVQCILDDELLDANEDVKKLVIHFEGIRGLKLKVLCYVKRDDER